MQKTTNESIELPGREVAILLFVAAALWFFADFCYIGAFSNNGNITTITTVATLLPVFATLLKFCWTRELPSMDHILSYICVVGAIYFLVRGDSSSPTSTP